MEESVDPPDSYRHSSLISRVLSKIFVKHASLEELVSRAKGNGNKVRMTVRPTGYNGKYCVEAFVTHSLYRDAWISRPFSYDAAEILSKAIARKFRREGIAVEIRYER